MLVLYAMIYRSSNKVDEIVKSTRSQRQDPLTGQARGDFNLPLSSLSEKPHSSLGNTAISLEEINRESIDAARDDARRMFSAERAARPSSRAYRSLAPDSTLWVALVRSGQLL